MRAAGIAPIARAVAEAAPWLGDRLDAFTDGNQLTLLPVRITTVDRWTEPGLLLIGDAAHVISPVGGNGINFRWPTRRKRPTSWWVRCPRRRSPPRYSTPPPSGSSETDGRRRSASRPPRSA